ncbi:hypothetical protein EHS17_08165 [Rhodobacteraceae bacterium CH30]|nr:hypothetical protein EHS17_08165 [Rhodobacteraceae bacterium CH30]
MKKCVYLSNPAIQAFTEWFAEELNQPKYPHAYLSARGRSYAFAGVADAMQQYDWSFRFEDGDGKLWEGHTLAENQSALDHLSHHLQQALADGNDEATRVWCTTVMKWGGVMNGNAKWLADNQAGLAAHVAGVKAILDMDDDAGQYLTPIHRFNAGMTKVYSLLCSSFIIYDSRVAAALAWFVVRWCQETGRYEVPELLAFPCLPPKQDKNASLLKIRNPSVDGLRFPALVGAPKHAQWNLRASWVLDASLDKAKHADFGNNLRALEAALFMWGYDLGNRAGQRQVKAMEAAL